MELIKDRILDSVLVKKKIMEDEKIINIIESVGSKLAETIENKGKIVICGNGGSASDAIHFAGEIVGRFQRERSAWPAIALNSDIAVLTAIANDYGYDNVFARQVEAHLTPKDMFIGISTSGNSENVYRAVLKAKSIGSDTVGLLGGDGGKIAREVKHSIVIPSRVTARIQESHIMIIHILCEIIETKLEEYEK